MAEKKTTAKTAPAPAVETVENPVNKMIDGLAVSYTHLTLPTIA